MADEEHVEILRQGVEAWNQWRRENEGLHPDLSSADLKAARLMVADLSAADLSRADLRRVHLDEAHPSGADLSGAHLSRADLSKADLGRATLVSTNVAEANLTGCRVYGISAWNVNLVGAQQSELVITPDDETEITVDDLEVAQFIYLLLHNEKIRRVIETVTSKTVLILGRFTPRAESCA